MGSYSRTYNFTDGTTAYGSEVVTELDALGSSVNNIVNAQIASGASIADSKLAQISTAGKVSGAALTSLTSVPSGAGVIPVANIPTKIVQVVVKTLATATKYTGYTVVPLDDTKPTWAEGADIGIQQAITGTASNKLLITAQIHWGSTTMQGASMIISLFKDGSGTDECIASQICNAQQNQSYAGGHSLLIFEDTIADGSAHNYDIRMGSRAASDDFTINGYNNSRVHGGSLISSVTFQEVQV